MLRLSEQHPREQGLKPGKRLSYFSLRMLSEQHPREQGLKPNYPKSNFKPYMAFQSNIQENKDWNQLFLSRESFSVPLSEQHPREQGLKQTPGISGTLPVILSEQHPREQGLKPPYTFSVTINPNAHFQSNIQENKDWNNRLILSSEAEETPFRATSKRTRIETWHNSTLLISLWLFQSNIQENKDLNISMNLSSNACVAAFRATSKRTRIETPFSWPDSIIPVFFQSNIQENKDWNWDITKEAFSPNPLSEQHPREQGLKLGIPTQPASPFRLSEQHPREQGLKHCRYDTSHVPSHSFRATSKRTRIETNYPPTIQVIQVAFRATSKRTRIETWWVSYAIGTGKTVSFRATSKRTRIETYNCTLLSEYIPPLSEQHPREQGLKPGSGRGAGRSGIRFQSNIQENKDWNKFLQPELVSTRNFQSNIQENKDWNLGVSFRAIDIQSNFQSNIQENKDWN